jgi:hypothetical protein
MTPTDAAVREPRAYPLAPMSAVIASLTLLVIAIPIVLVGSSVFVPDSPLLVPGALVFTGIMAVWCFWRPSHFRLDDDGLLVVFPLRRRRIPWSSIAGATTLDQRGFRQRFRWGLRIGVGGLWGGFGWLWTAQGLLDMYISRLDRWALVERRGARPLLVNPHPLDEFVTQLNARKRAG